MIFQEYYPINVLRNVGLKNIDSPYVFLADIDFLPMVDTYSNIKNSIASLKTMDKQALVVPAFETQRYRSRFPRSKTELLQMIDNRKIFTFRFDVWAAGHAPTNYQKWRTAKVPYPVRFEFSHLNFHLVNYVTLLHVILLYVILLYVILLYVILRICIQMNFWCNLGR